MKRSLLLALVLALAAVTSAQAHEGAHAGTGSITAVSADSITVVGEVTPQTAKGNELTCAVAAERSPSVAGLKTGDRVYVLCDYLDGRPTLVSLVRKNLVRKFSGTIVALSRSAVTVRTAKGRQTCAVNRATAAKLKGMKVGHKVALVCRQADAKLVLVSAQHVAGHHGHHDG